MYSNLCNNQSTDAEELNVLLKEGSRTTRLWWLSGNHGDSWQHGEVTIGRIPQDFTILFEASRTFDMPGYIAIDDVDFTNCSLPGRLPPLPVRSDVLFIFLSLLKITFIFYLFKNYY